MPFIHSQFGVHIASRLKASHQILMQEVSVRHRDERTHSTTSLASTTCRSALHFYW